MLLAMATLALMDATMKELAGRYAALQVAALRGLLSLPFVVAWIYWRDRGFRTLWRIRWPWHLLRGVLALVMRGRWNVTPTGRVRFVLFGVGALDLIGNVGYVTAVNLAPLAVVAVVASLYPAVTVLMARFVYSEILSPAQIAGLGLAVVAVACFSVVG